MIRGRSPLTPSGRRRKAPASPRFRSARTRLYRCIEGSRPDRATQTSPAVSGACLCGGEGGIGSLALPVPRAVARVIEPSYLCIEGSNSSSPIKEKAPIRGLFFYVAERESAYYQSNSIRGFPIFPLFPVIYRPARYIAFHYNPSLMGDRLGDCFATLPRTRGFWNGDSQTHRPQSRNCRPR